MSFEQKIRDRLVELAMEGKVKASPEARRLINRADNEETDYLAEHALAISRAIAEGKTGAHGVRVSITTRFEARDDQGKVDILAVKTEVDADGGRFWISVE